jgi:pimeloyl-ACP methyl ester carboxylesterase
MPAASARSQRGYTVVSLANPLRSPAGDAAYVASVLRAIDGPVVLVGHSYGGAVISEAAATVGNVRSLVYLNALALDAGESNLDISDRSRAASARPCGRSRRPPAPTSTSTPASFRAVFAADLPARITDRLASAQRPVSLAACRRSPPSRPGRRSRRGTSSVAATRSSRRPPSGSWPSGPARHTVEIDASHACYLSGPARSPG